MTDECPCGSLVFPKDAVLLINTESSPVNCSLLHENKDILISTEQTFKTISSQFSASNIVSYTIQFPKTVTITNKIKLVIKSYNLDKILAILYIGSLNQVNTLSKIDIYGDSIVSSSSLSNDRLRLEISSVCDMIDLSCCDSLPASLSTSCLFDPCEICLPSYNILINISGSWNKLGNDIYGESYGNYLGYSISLSNDGSILALGSHQNSGNGENSGHVRVYSWNGSSWIQRGSDIDGEAAGDYSGLSVSLSSDGSIIAIGAHHNDGNGINSGSVRVYVWNGSSWVKRGGDIDGDAYDFSGHSVSLNNDGNILAIGNAFNGNQTQYCHIRVYYWSGSSWIKRGDNINLPFNINNGSGGKVSISGDGNRLAIGSPYDGGYNGCVRIYFWNNNTWTQLGNTIYGNNDDSFVGFHINLSRDGSTVIIGAQSESNNGSIRILYWNGSSWIQRGDTIYGENPEDFFVYNSLNYNGNIIAIGSSQGDIGGTNSGYVKIYYWNGSTWTQNGNTIIGTAPNDEAGAVCLSSDGNILAIGAPRNDGNGLNSGQVRVYKLT